LCPPPSLLGSSQLTKIKIWEVVEAGVGWQSENPPSDLKDDQCVQDSNTTTSDEDDEEEEDEVT
jgi:hypothetical protein